MIYIIILAAILILFLITGFKIIRENTKAVVITLGRITRVLNPGIRYSLWPFERVELVDTKIATIDLDKQEIITKDRLHASINISVIYEIEHADRVIKVDNVTKIVKDTSNSHVKSSFGNLNSDEIIAHRQSLSDELAMLARPGSHYNL
jgi:regulator of protease activity HflC (stomatin/prohibitin superfamily)